jgi:hypothetical protein
MARRYRLAMDFFDGQHQAPPPQWTQMAEAAARTQSKAEQAELVRLQQRVEELEANVADYEALLAELPELFERKFQQRLEPLLERYRLLAQAQDIREAPRAPLRRAALRWGWPGVRRISGTPDDEQRDSA